jgi:MoxR-like ATPase
VTLEDIRQLQSQVRAISVSDELKHYMVAITRATREQEGVKLGASPRAALTLMKCAQALSLLDGFEYVIPDTIQEIAVSAIAHRIILDPQAQFTGLRAEAVVANVLRLLPVPV